MDKKMVIERYGDITYQLEGKATSVVSFLNGLIEKYGESVCLDIDYSKEFVAYYEREETDKEYEKRLAREKKAREDKKIEKLKKEERERKEFERLKAKFEKLEEK